jgi:GxxExxY protein
MEHIKTLSNQVRETAYSIHVCHGNGYLEKVYENALAHRLSKAGYHVEQQKPITIKDEDGTVIGEFFADIVLDRSIIIELKACKALTNEHRSQVLHYLKATGIEHGLLINFGSFKFQIQKFIMDDLLHQ